ncbi:hypothetical protein [Bacteroides reticulotermitis]|uniref:hypothetical protein n=1 Tax=Bacteroides reticulotermitis TaxID=1133319 RepID=UPI003A88443E
MRNLLQLTTLMAMCILILSCQKERPASNASIVVNEFPINLKLTPTIAPEFDEEIGLISISKVGKYILATKAKQDYFFTIFDSEHTKLIDICRKGNGPNEFIAPIYLEQYEVIGGETKIWVLERVTNTFCLINIEQTIKEKELVIDNQYDFHKLNKTELRHLFQINDSIFIGTAQCSESLEFKVTIFNIKNNAVTPKDNFLPFIEDAPAQNYQLTQNWLSLKPDKSAFVSSFSQIPELDLYKISGERYLSLFYKEILTPADLLKTDASVERNELGQTYATDSYIYVLSTESKEQGVYEYYILVFNWDGKPIVRLKIAAADSFFVDEESRKIYTVCFEKDEGNVMTYDLPDLTQTASAE